jgi:hypothetical protein
MRRALLTSLALALWLGCQREAPPASQAATSNAVAAEGEIVQPATPAEVPPAEPPTATPDVDLNAVLGELTQVVRRYGMERQRVPADLEELVQAGYLARLPEAPPGQRFVITKRMEVQLVHR